MYMYISHVVACFKNVVKLSLILDCDTGKFQKNLSVKMASSNVEYHIFFNI